MQHINVLTTLKDIDQQILLLESNIGEHQINIGKKEKVIGSIEKTIGVQSKEIGTYEKKIGELEKKIGEIQKQIGVIEREIGEEEKDIGTVEKIIGEWSHLKNSKLREYKETPYYYVKRWILKNHSHLLDDYNDTISDGQIESKNWLSQSLRSINFKEDLHIEIIGGWFGFPLIEMLSNLPIKQIDFYEIDDNCKKVLTQYIEQFNYNFRIVQFGDYFERKDLRRRDLIINTSCEHMKDISCMKQFYKGNPYIALQSNNFYEHDHVNCVDSEVELRNKNEIKVTSYMGKKKMEKYDRFMVIGTW